MGFFNCTSYLVADLVENYNAFLGIFVAGGFSYLIYCQGVRMKNFFLMSEKYETRCFDTVMLLQRITLRQDKIQYGESPFIFKESGQRLSPQQTLRIVILFNLFMQMGILYRKGIIDRGLVFFHFSNTLQKIFEDPDARGIMDFLERHIQEKAISYLYKKFAQRRERAKKIYNFHRFFKKENVNVFGSPETQFKNPKN